jgi:drug/metabolite transporter (DMT)-like permease
MQQYKRGLNMNGIPYLGEILAILTAVCWAITSTSFEHAGKKMGSVTLNLIRLWFAFVFLMIYTGVTRGFVLPVDASVDTWKWLLLSGFVGFFIGDLLLFEAFTQIGARISMLIFASVPPMSAMLALVILGDRMTIYQIIGMVITVTGIGIVILTRDNESEKGKVKFAHPVLGISLAFGGAFCQALGYIIGKLGMNAGALTYDAFASTQIRAIAGIVAFTLFITIRKGWKDVKRAFTYRKAMKFTIIGSVFGPFIGVSLSLAALNYTTPGVASTLTSITPVLLLPVAIFVYKEKLNIKEILGAFTAIIGIAIMFIS